MKKKSASRSTPALRSLGEGGFFNLRVLIGLFVVLAGVVLALLGFGGFSALAQSIGKGKQKSNGATSSLSPFALPPGFDCSKVHELGIDKQDNFKAGMIMMACAEVEAGSPSVSPFNTVSRAIREFLSPLAFGAGDVDLITGPETSTNITQSETFTTANPANPNQIVVAYNDSRSRPFSGWNISGASVSTDGGTTFTRLTANTGRSPFDGTLGDPVILYNRANSTWYTVWLDCQCAANCGSFPSLGLGGYKTTTPWDPNSWTHFCVHTGTNDDRESGWVDNNPSSAFFGHMYVSHNDFNVGSPSGALFVRVSTDNGNTWTPHQLTNGFIRDVQITGDLITGDVYVAGLSEGPNGGLAGPRANLIFRSTDGGSTWTNTYTGPNFNAPGRVNCGVNPYFVCMYPDSSGGFAGYWRYMGIGQPAAFNHVVSYVYTAHGAGADPGDVYYIRSTDSGVTFSAPFKLNTDVTTRLQWQPNLSVSDAGTLFSTWYDERETASCTIGNTGVPCYRMWARKSNDNGMTWLPDDMFSDVISPLPAQPDTGIQPNYAGDYDYGSAILTKHLTSWVDGRVAINSASQQDAFTDRELVGFAVTTSDPACNSIINTQPTDFVINLSDPVDPATVQATDFTVNGIPADSFVLSNGNATITFHFNSSPVTTPSPQTMHIPANAFNRASDNQGNFEFQCSFCYDTAQLMVTTTVPPVGGTFTPPAPGDYQYDVNWNLPVDPSSVSTADLTLTGNAGGSVTNVQVINGNTTTRFTVHFNFGGSATATIGAGAITAHTCNGSAAFTGMYTVEGCPPQNHYDIAQIGGSIVAGSTDIGNHGDDQVTTITLPFNYTLYDQTYTGINLSSNGNAQFTTTDNFWENNCLPWLTHNYTIFPYWDDLRTETNWTCTPGPCGIYTSTSGSAPNRIFNIEWRAVYYSGGVGTGNANFELRLYEGQTRFDVIYGQLTNSNTSATAGLQKDDSTFDQYFCNGSGGAATAGQSYILQTCGTPTPTPTASPSATPTATATATATATPTATPTATATATATATPTATPTPRPTPTPRSQPTPRPRPTPPPRP